MRNSTGPSITAKVCRLAVDEPAPLAPVLELAQLGIGGLELLLLLPLPQDPFRRPVDAGVGVVAVEVEQLGDQRLPLAGGEAVRSRTSPGPGSAPGGLEVSGWKRMASIFWVAR